MASPGAPLPDRSGYLRLSWISSQVLLWGAAWDQTRDAELTASEYINLVLRNIGAETESTTVRATLSQLQSAADLYVAGSRRDETRQRVADELWALAENAQPGSDNQLQFVMAFASAASTSSQWERVRKIRAGELALDGLTIDTDLSWLLLASLAAGGLVAEDDIDTALASDNTANGAELAARARAARPDALIKGETWTSLVYEDHLPNAIVRAAAQGFMNPAHRDLLEPFVPRYFEAVLSIWRSRTFKIAEYLIEGLYPTPLASTALRDASRAWLDSHVDAPSSLRRIIAEGLADVERALAAQELDALSP